MEKQTKPYTVGSTPILHDGQRYEPGEEVELTAKEAKRLGDRVAAATAKSNSKQSGKGADA